MGVAYSRADHGHAALDSISHLPAYNAISSAFSYFAGQYQARKVTKIDFWTRATLSELSICHDQTILGAGSVGPLASFFPQLVGFVRTSAIVRTLSEHCPNIEKCCWRPVGVSIWNHGIRYTEVTDGSGLFSTGSRIRDFRLHFPAG